MLSKFLQDFMDLFSMGRDVVCGMDQNVVHIDGQPVFA